MQQLGIDLSATPSVLDTRDWRWLRVRIQGLLADPRSRIHAALAPPAPSKPTYRTPAQVPAPRKR